MCVYGFILLRSMYKYEVLGVLPVIFLDTQNLKFDSLKKKCKHFLNIYRSVLYKLIALDEDRALERLALVLGPRNGWVA